MWTRLNPVTRPVIATFRFTGRAVKATGRAIAHSARSTKAGLSSRPGRIAVQSTLTAGVLAGILAAGQLLVPHAGPSWAWGDLPEAEEPAERRTLALTPEEAALLDVPAPEAPDDGFGFDEVDSPTEADPIEESGDIDTTADLQSWAAELSGLGIPERALVAYGRAELVSGAQNPSCNLSWTTLAAIGHVESSHGEIHGNRITPDGETLRPIIGPDYDEVGPMQFLPSTWEEWGTSVDGSEDGDPHNIDDATLSAANYLCSNDRDLTDPEDWYSAVHGYNPIDSYVHQVFTRADDYGERSHAI